MNLLGSLQPGLAPGPHCKEPSKLRSGNFTGGDRRKMGVVFGALGGTSQFAGTFAAGSAPEPHCKEPSKFRSAIFYGGGDRGLMVAMFGQCGRALVNLLGPWQKIEECHFLRGETVA